MERPTRVGNLSNCSPPAYAQGPLFAHVSQENTIAMEWTGSSGSSTTTTTTTTGRLLYGNHHHTSVHAEYLTVHDDDYLGSGIPLNDVTRPITIVIHYLAIPAVTFAIWCVIQRFDIIRRRIYSPFLLLVALTWLLMGSTFEIANHFYIDNWQLYDPQADLINGSFSFFNFGAQNLLAFSLRHKHFGLGFSGKSGILQYMATIWDPIFLVLIIVNPIVYAVAGRSTSVTALSPIASIAGLFIMFRTWYNLGPNIYTKCGGIFFFILVICGVVMLSVYRNTNTEWVHILIGGSFVSSTIPLAIAFLYATEEAQQQDDGREEEISHPADNNLKPEQPVLVSAVGTKDAEDEDGVKDNASKDVEQQ